MEGLIKVQYFHKFEEEEGTHIELESNINIEEFDTTQKVLENEIKNLKMGTENERKLIKLSNSVVDYQIT